MKHLKYLSYVLRHKWFVFAECWREGIPLRGLVHDWHKLLPSEWTPYVNYFYGEPDERAFDFAWLLHQKRADHHWQWWLLPEDDGGTKTLPMSSAARIEMLCDWCGASKAQGHGGWPGVAKWYEKNKGKMQLHPRTRQQVELALAVRIDVVK